MKTFIKETIFNTLIIVQNFHQKRKLVKNTSLTKESEQKH